MDNGKLILKHMGRDSFDRPVYECDGKLYVDTDPRCAYPDICTKSNNDFFGEPSFPIPRGVTVEFVPQRDTWDS